MHDIAPAPASRHGRTLPIARLATLALVLALAACKGQGDGKDGDDKADANKPPEAVPVEVARAERRNPLKQRADNIAMHAHSGSQTRRSQGLRDSR